MSSCVKVLWVTATTKNTTNKILLFLLLFLLLLFFQFKQLRAVVTNGIESPVPYMRYLKTRRFWSF